MDPAIDFALRAALGLLFAAAAAHKLRDLPRFRATVREYRLLPGPLAGPASGAIVAAELVVATALVLPATRAAGYAGTALLAATYAIAIGVNLRRGRRDLDCGCLGAGGREALSWWLVARNVVVTAIALASLGPPLARPLGWVDAVTAIGLFAFAVLGWIAADGLVANLPAVERARA
jgi:uncharacterized membrane protein YeiB